MLDLKGKKVLVGGIEGLSRFMNRTRDTNALQLFGNAAGIDQSPADRHFPGSLNGFRINQNPISGFCNENSFLRYAGFLSKQGMRVQLAVFPMNGNKIPRLGKVEHYFKLFAAGMPGNMRCPMDFIVNPGATPAKMINQS